MKIAALAGIALLFVLLYYMGEKENSQPLDVLKVPDFSASAEFSKDLADFEWDSNKGQTLGRKDFLGHWTLLNFWANWCWPCHLEIPLLQAAVSSELSDLPLQVILINIDEDNSDHQLRAWEFLEKERILLPTLNDPHQMLSRYLEVSGYPYHVLIDPQGKIRFAETGGIDWSAPATLKGLKTLLSSPDVPTPKASSSKSE
jgi:alkyl hydroperoxide reductase subunit AhpC